MERESKKKKKKKQAKEGQKFNNRLKYPWTGKVADCGDWKSTVGKKRLG